MELGRDCSASYRERVAVGTAGRHARRGVGVENGHGSAIGTILRRCSVAELVDTSDNMT
jgi:hypothetical protein